MAGRALGVIVAAAAVALAGCSAGPLARAEAGREVQPTAAPAASADAVQADRFVRLEVWTPTRTVASGEPVDVTGRATNISRQDVWYPDKPCSTPMIGWVRFPSYDEFGRHWPDARERAKQAWARGSGLPTERFLTPANAALHRTMARGERCNPDRHGPTLRRLAPGASITLHTAQKPEWVGQRLPAGPATVGMLFSYGTSRQYNAMTEQAVYAAVPARVSGGATIVPPGRAVDAALALPRTARYAAAHARDTQLSLNAQLEGGRWVVTMSSIDVGGATKRVAPELVVHVDAASGRVV